jgi:hypothetical protein
MAAPLPPSPRFRWADSLLIVAFFVLLGLPLLDQALHLDNAPVTGENRLLASPPAWSGLHAGALRKYTGGWEAYYDDHFGFRNRLVRLYQHWHLNLFHDNSVYRVIVGQHDWLFWAQEQMVENYLGLAPFTDEELQTWRDLLEHRRDWLAQQGIRYVFVIPPDKQNIYPEFLPTWLIQATPAHRRTKVDQFLDYMSTNSTVPIVDLRAPLLAAKTSQPVYLKNDTHWNEYGAFIACQYLIGDLARTWPGEWPPLRLEDFRLTACARPVAGDIGRIIDAPVPEANYVTLAPRPGYPLPGIVNVTNIEFQWKWHNISSLSTNAAAPPRTAVVFHDSFGLDWKPYLGVEFRQILYMYDDREFNRKVIAEYHPDIVISEIVERYFDTIDPHDLMAMEGWR